MNGGKRAGRKIENFFGFGAHHLAHALGFLLGDAGQVSRWRSTSSTALARVVRISPASADKLARRAQQPFAFGHRFADQRPVSALAWLAVSPIRVWAPRPRPAERRSGASVVLAASLASFSRSASRAKLCGELAGARGGVCHDHFEMAFGIARDRLELLRLAAEAQSPVPSPPFGGQGVLEGGLSSFSRSINSFMAVRWRSWRPSTNSARAIAASATDSMRLACLSSSTAAACGASAAAFAA
jgi:hypothetical protein